MSRLHISFRGPVGPMTREASVDPQVSFQGRSKLRHTNYFINVVTSFNLESKNSWSSSSPSNPHPHTHMRWGYAPTSWVAQTGPSCIDTVLLNLGVLKLWFCQIYQNCIVTDWQCIGTDWQTSRQSIANSVTNPCMSWELEYYRDRPKCLGGGPFRLSVFTPAPILFCHSANIHRSANPMSIRG